MAFPNMSSRSDIKERAPGSGDWLLNHEQYTSWFDQGGMLLLSGRPGCGKTTLVDYLVTEANQRSPDSICLSFFFQKSGQELRRSALGLFRSLVYQILSHEDSLLEMFLKDTSFEHCWKTQELFEWRVSELHDLFRSYAKRLATGGRLIRLYIDALDEAEPDCTQILLSFHQDPVREHDWLSICISSRPSSSLPTSQFTPTVNIYQENHPDAVALLNVAFIDVEARMSTRNMTISNFELPYIKERLMTRASGLLQWLAMIVPRVVKLIERGESVAYIVLKIDRYPKELSEVYRAILDVINEDDVEEALRLFEWIVIARQPLTLEDLQAASCLDIDTTYELSLIHI